MQTLRKLEHVVSANGASTTRRKDGVTLHEQDLPVGIEEARGPRLFALKLAMPRYLCVGFAVMRI